MAQGSRRFTGAIIQESGATEKRRRNDGALEYRSTGRTSTRCNNSSLHYSTTPIFSCLCFLRPCRIHVSIASERDGFGRHHSTNRPMGSSRPPCYHLSRSIPWLGCLPVR